MRLPAHTRIILIPDDEQSAREYGISRRMVIMLVVLLALATITMGVLMVSFARQQNARLRLNALEQELAAATLEVRTAAQLRRELEETRALQEKLLFMLGVRPDSALASSPGAAGDQPAGSARDNLQRAATLAVTPAPRLWPAAGFVTREFDRGNTVEGDLPHPGIDIAGPENSPILAAAPGEVVRTGTHDFLGNFVEIQHGLGYLTVYGHCARLAVARGDRVQAGQVIAYMGQSGQVTAPHLHFEIWDQGEAVDPRRVLAGDPPPQ
ncbi:MAG: M23 family metallopeptidase [bacterium]